MYKGKTGEKPFSLVRQNVEFQPCLQIWIESEVACHCITNLKESWIALFLHLTQSWFAGECVQTVFHKKLQDRCGLWITWCVHYFPNQQCKYRGVCVCTACASSMGKCHSVHAQKPYRRYLGLNVLGLDQTTDPLSRLFKQEMKARALSSSSPVIKGIFLLIPFIPYKLYTA